MNHLVEFTDEDGEAHEDVSAQVESLAWVDIVEEEAGGGETGEEGGRQQQ